MVDQKRNIGALVVARARAAGNPVFYLPGIAMKKARDMFPATAKTDEIDAEVIARTAMGMPWTLREVAEEAPSTTALRMLASQRDFAVRSRTKAAKQAARGAPRGGPRLRGRRRPVEPLATRRPR